MKKYSIRVTSKINGVGGFTDYEEIRDLIKSYKELINDKTINIMACLSLDFVNSLNYLERKAIEKTEYTKLAEALKAEGLEDSFTFSMAKTYN